MDPTARSRAYEKFCKSPAEEGAVLLATDVAARGIDVEAVQWIVQVGPITYILGDVAIRYIYIYTTITIHNILLYI